MGVPRVFASAPTGYFAKQMGWELFFIFCALAAIPGLLLILTFTKQNINHPE
jgi:PAT family beta-lactamase induction signal transducer AmpG